MAVIIPQVVTSDRATGAQVIDGSLKFDDGNKNYLERTPGSAGNRQTFTWSGWIKRSSIGAFQVLFGSYSGADDFHHVRFRNVETLETRLQVSNTDELQLITNQVFRDLSGGWYHIVFAFDSTQSTNSDKAKLYVNGSQITSFSSETYPTGSPSSYFSSTTTQSIGRRGDDNFYHDGSMSQVYFIDGQALGPEYFGFTDGLTNTWKPKKYVNTTASHGDVGGVVGFGTNGFYLPFDGSAPIGQDQSGQGNDFTPVNFGGSVALDSPLVTGAKPILNTTQGGTQAGVGVFGSKQNVGYAVTVYNDGGGNKYYIDGVKQATLTGLIRGATYTFDTSDSSNSGHPFRFSESDGGSEYTNGVAAITGTATTITIPYNSSNNLYYYCTNHSGMGSSITGITTNEKLADQYASHVTLALPLVGSNGDVSVSVACTSSIKATANSGNAAASSDTSNFYAGSFEFDGTGDYITVTDSSEITLGAGDFTIEYWQNLDSVSGNPTPFDKGYSGSGIDGNGWVIQYSSSKKKFYVGGTAVLTDTDNTPTGKWIHWAFVRSSGTLKMYRDGIEKVSASNSTDLSHATNLGIGANLEAGSGFTAGQGAIDGYLSDIRIYKGVAKYTSNFVVPATSPDILPDTPSGVSGGSKLTKATDGAVSFDGNATETSTGLTVTTNIDWSSDFTVEGFIYSNELAGGRTIFDCWNGNSSGTGFYIWTNSSGDIDLVKDASTYYSQTWCGAGSINAKKWSHFAIVRSSNVLNMYINGVKKSGSGYSISDSWSSSRGCILGSGSGNSSMKSVNGFMNNVRISQTAVYTSNFTPPTTSLPSLGSDTKVLGLKSHQSVTSTEVGTITDVGGTAATTFNPFNTDINTVRGQESGYATLNPLRGELTLSDGNLHAVGVSNWGSQTADFLMSSGKWYYEYHDVVSNEHVIGIGPPDVSITGNLGSGTPPGFGYGSETGAKYSDGGNTSYGDSWTSGDVIGVAFDVDAGELSFYKNGIDQGVAFTGLTTEYVPVISINGTSRSASVNFGQKPFKFPPPDGFQPLNTANARPVNVISRPDQYVGVTTGNFDQQKTHDIGFQPDLIWHKSRAVTGTHFLTDSVRGVNSYLVPNSGNAAGTFPVGGQYGVTSINYNGWTQGSYGPMSESSMVAWTWKAGGNKNTFNVDDVGYATAAAAGLDAGVVTPSAASVGTKQGLSIVKYNGTAGQSCAHGLTQAPELIIEKEIGQTSAWTVQTTVIDGSLDYLYLNTLAGASDYSIDAPTSTVFDIGRSNECIAYLWHSVPGFSKFGSFTTNNSSTEYVHLGFKPAILWIKRTGKGSTTNLSVYGSWYVNNSETSPVNPASYEQVLWLNRNYAEGKRGNGGAAGTYLNVDFLSDGFRMRGSANAEIGQPNDINIYCAWAEAPSVDLFGGGANAR